MYILKMMAERHNFQNFLNALRKPSKFLREFERVASRQTFELNRGEGINVVEKDWDNLIILDCCRTDYFREICDIQGEYESVVSQGNESRSFIEHNFAGRDLSDTIYVTANPFVEYLDKDVFYRVDYSEVYEGWDQELRTVPPEVVSKRTKIMHEEYPNKRIISHFMQPHAPYIGDFGQSLVEKHDFGILNNKLRKEGYDIPNISIPQAVKNGPVSKEELRKAYKENLEIVWDEVKSLLDNINGKTVITSDHGEMLGEELFGRERYGHGRYHTSELRIVPWFGTEYEERRDITKGDITKGDITRGFDYIDDRESRLIALGYK